ncbi:DUF732 domain-containing protein [Mycolicibacterium moriokaense]|nr:DUF732 domain-containing protein [Mycolicibacterium moriokaense]
MLPVAEMTAIRVNEEDSAMPTIKSIFAATALALATGLAVAAPASAQPDEDGYLNDMRDNGGFTGSDSEMLDWGYRACDDWQDGVNRDVIINNIYQNTDESIGRGDAKFLFESATIFLC